MSAQEDKQVTMSMPEKSIPIDKVWAAQKHLATILHEVDKSANQKRSINWVVTDAASGSYSVTVEGLPSAEFIQSALIVKTISYVKDGLKLLAQEAIRPPHFTDIALKSIRCLSKLAPPDRPINLFNTKYGEVVVSRDVGLNIDKIIGAIYKSYGSIEGALNVIDMRDRPIFKITDPLTFDTIECCFESSMLDRAKEYLEKRVYVYGLVASREDGTKVRINVDELDLLRAEDTLPTIDEMIGLWSAV
jgi:hypothetical protein